MATHNFTGHDQKLNSLSSSNVSGEASQHPDNPD